MQEALLVLSGSLGTAFPSCCRLSGRHDAWAFVRAGTCVTGPNRTAVPGLASTDAAIAPAFNDETMERDMAFVHTRPQETDEQSRARLAAAPQGSINRQLAELPINIRERPRGLTLLLPRTGLVVVPIEYRPSLGQASGNPRPGSDGWGCVVVRGNDTYPVGGHDIVVSSDEIRRGLRITGFVA